MKFATLTSSLLVGKGKAQPMPSGAWGSLREAGESGGLRVVPTRVSGKHRHLRIENAVMQADGLHAKCNRLTVRVHPTRYLRIKLAAGHMGTTIQDLVSTALDSYLDRAAERVMGGSCACLNAPAVDDDAKPRAEDGRNDADPADPAA